MGWLIEFIDGVMIPAVLIVIVAGAVSFAIISLVEWIDK